MSLMSAARRSIGASVPFIGNGVETDKFGMPIFIETPHDEWKEVLEEIIPVFGEVGWLDGLDKITISRGSIIGTDVGNYGLGRITLEHSYKHYGREGSYIVSMTRRGVLTHEMIHHAHISGNGFTLRHRKNLEPDEEEIVTTYVSKYGTTNRGEAVAEIGTGIILGEEYPNPVHDIYAKYNGPAEVYEIREML